jgi:prophage maintenance system killer protein
MTRHKKIASDPRGGPVGSVKLKKNGNSTRNHPFIDGNKRTALLAIYTFLGINDVDFVVPETDAAAMILSLAAGEVSEENLARWIRDNWPKA